jgi:hypothetical protein
MQYRVQTHNLLWMNRVLAKRASNSSCFSTEQKTITPAYVWSPLGFGVDGHTPYVEHPPWPVAPLRSVIGDRHPVHKNAFLNLEAPTVPLDFAGVDAMAVRAALRFSTCPIQVDMATRNPYPLMALRDYGHGWRGRCTTILQPALDLAEQKPRQPRLHRKLLPLCPPTQGCHRMHHPIVSVHRDKDWWWKAALTTKLIDASTSHSDAMELLPWDDHDAVLAKNALSCVNCV